MPDDKSNAGFNATAKLIIGLLFLTCVGLLIAVIVLSVGKTDSSDGVFKQCQASTPLRATYSNSKDLFRDLTEDEIIGVRDYVLNEASLNVTAYERASVDSNYIFLIELKNPDKGETLSYLDAVGRKPKRMANIVLFKGAVSPPVVEELLVPVEEPKSHTVSRRGRKHPIPFHYRPHSLFEAIVIQNIVDKFTREARNIMWESFEMNCSASCVTTIPNAPYSMFQSGERRNWVRFHRLVVGSYIHPIPLEVFIQHEGRDVGNWKIEQVFYNNVVFDSVESFVNAYESGNVSKVSQAAPKGEGLLYSTLERRGESQPTSPLREPRQFEPNGKRYTAENNHVEFMGWSFDFRIRSSSGPQLFDVRFNNTRIVYELSLQEATAFYGGFSPVPTYADYLDCAWALGKSFELVKGVDCPSTASYFDVVTFVDAAKPTKRRNAVCVFELNTGMPLRRHFEFNQQGSYAFYGGMPSTALVFRTIITPYNYDYIYDYVFYPNGVIEVKVATSGYILSSFWTPEERRYATKVHKDVAATMHDHLFHFKVDLDIAGRKNSFETISSKVNKTTRWAPKGSYHYEKYFERDLKKTEKAAVYNYDFQTPCYLNFYNEAGKNSHGVRRGYRVQLNGIMKQMYTRDWPYTRGFQWSYNQLVVTKYKGNESRSSSMYNQMDTFDPVIDFSEFIKDDEDIKNEDLVSWITVGVMHLPHSEDVPNTATAGNSAGFFLRPFNYFDEDPSVASRDGVLITPSGEGSKVMGLERAGGSSCVPRDDPIVFSGMH